MSNLLIDIPVRAGRDTDNSIAKKVNSKAKTSTTSVKGGGGLLNLISMIKAKVEQYLGKDRDKYICIQDEQTLHDYITAIIDNRIVAIDTETTGLDPMLDKIVGISLYTPGQKPAYIPINHVSYITGMRCDNQLDIEIVRRELERLTDVELENIMFNSCFDMRVIKNQVGVELLCTWDTSLASRCMNENEPSKKLKPLHQKYCLNGEEEEFTFDELFKGVTFDLIPISTAYLYAAKDGIVTYEFYEFQKKYLYYDADRPMEDRNGMNGVSWVFFNIEMPCVKAVADMEDTGVAFDFEYNEQLKVKYHKLLEDKTKAFYDKLEMYRDEIETYKKQNKNAKLDEPINVSSPPQLAILLYDIMKLPLPYDKKKKKETRGTGEDILKGFKNPVCDAILEYRGLEKLVSTYIDKLPECVNPNDGRIHGKFNQYGADTGRFSSNDPNLQNIPSHNKDIRPMFKATDGYVFLSADYSQQEIKGMAQMCGDEGMIEAFRQGKDFYAEIASVAFGYPYEECLEFRPDGTTNPAGKERRAQAKSILLGINYGRGAASIAEQLGCAKEKAEKIKEDVFKGFPAIAEFEKQSYDMVNTLGYVTTLWGRKRRLPSMLLPDYDFKWANDAPINSDILDFDSDDEEKEVPWEIQEKYRRKLSNCNFRDKKKIFEQANAEGIWIIDNTKDKDYTKVVNARIQGTAADLTKLAMIKLHNDKRLKELGFRMIIQVHDEILAECPKENAKEVIELFAKDMSEAPGDRFEIPLGCDVEVTDAWYGNKIEI